MSKFKFKSKKKNKFNFFNDNVISNDEIINETHIEFFSNKKVILDGCQNIVDYQEEYVKLKIKKGFLTIWGRDFLIFSFNQENLVMEGNISSIEFDV